MTVQTTHAITVPTSSSTRSPITAPSTARVCTAWLKVWHVMTKLPTSRIGGSCIVSPQFRVVPSSVTVINFWVNRRSSTFRHCSCINIRTFKVHLKYSVVHYYPALEILTYCKRCLPALHCNRWMPNVPVYRSPLVPLC